MHWLAGPGGRDCTCAAEHLSTGKRTREPRWHFLLRAKQSPHLVQALREGYVPEQPDETADRRTPSERKFDEMQRKREEEKVAKMAAKSHRDRVNDFNSYLANLSEHHDIPRVGPG